MSKIIRALCLILFLTVISCTMMSVFRDSNNIGDWVDIPEVGHVFVYEGIESNKINNSNLGFSDDYDIYTILTKKIIEINTNNNGSKIMKINEKKRIIIDSLSIDTIITDSIYYMIINYDSNQILTSENEIDYVDSWYDKIMIDCPIELEHEWSPYGHLFYGTECEIENIDYGITGSKISIMVRWLGEKMTYYEFDSSLGMIVKDSDCGRPIYHYDNKIYNRHYKLIDHYKE